MAGPSWPCHRGPARSSRALLNSTIPSETRPRSDRGPVSPGPSAHAAFPEREQREHSSAASGIVTGVLMALLIIYVLLAIPLKSYAQPFIIMSVIPFGTVGALIGHKPTGWDVVFFSILGIVALAGVVVNASLVMVHTINTRRIEGLSLGESVRAAATTRFRPIVLTTATTFLGLVPLMFEAAVPAAPLIPMAIALAYGVLYASVMTLSLVPIGYLVVEDFSRLVSERKEERISSGSSTEGLPSVGDG